MSPVALATEVFAKLAGRHLDHQTYLFEVSEAFNDEVESGEWSEPVRYRFVKDGLGALIAMEMQRLHATTYVPESKA